MTTVTEGPPQLEKVPGTPCPPWCYFDHEPEQVCPGDIEHMRNVGFPLSLHEPLVMSDFYGQPENSLPRLSVMIVRFGGARRPMVMLNADLCSVTDVRLTPTEAADVGRELLRLSQLAFDTEVSA